MGMFAFGLAILSALSFAIATPASKALLGSLPPFQLAGLLYLGAALGMTPGVVLERRAEQPARSIDRRPGISSRPCCSAASWRRSSC
jgi:drug/metabolite transporter (DMT)-like permease